MPPSWFHPIALHRTKEKMIRHCGSTNQPYFVSNPVPESKNKIRKQKQKLEKQKQQLSTVAIQQQKQQSNYHG